jgi:hypothetical protein
MRRLARAADVLSSLALLAFLLLPPALFFGSTAWGDD